ncbi:MAG: hypothetical protein HOE14_02725 [Gemmatimonadales bacterium]|jgi:uncharacterized ion transporter superfamily protein YfcC|nr:hypothetical protein [Gemmatimonadales bacterium]
MDGLAVTKSRFKVPDTLIILFEMVVLGPVASYVLPAGECDYFEERLSPFN